MDGGEGAREHRGRKERRRKGLAPRNIQTKLRPCLTTSRDRDVRDRERIPAAALRDRRYVAPYSQFALQFGSGTVH
jgi:hypothetical protein